MDKWVAYALVSMVFAGLTAVIAKLGLAGITGELGLAVRTCFVFGLVLSFAAFNISRTELAALNSSNVAWLALSGLTTTISWLYYYRAIKLGEVSTVAIIDKGSILVVIALAWLILGERITGRIAVGSLLVLAGLFIVTRK